MSLVSKAVDSFKSAGDVISGFGPAAEIVGGYFQNEANAKQAELNRRFQRQMSNTAYQRAVKDMKAAGLNPMLSGINSAPASTPGGAQAGIENVMRNVTSNTRTAKLQNQELSNLEATEGQIAATAGNQRAGAVELNTRAAKNNQDAATALELERKIRMERKLLGLDVHRRRAEAILYETLGAGAVGLQKLAPGLLGASALSVFRRGGKAARLASKALPAGRGVMKPNVYKRKAKQKLAREIRNQKRAARKRYQLWREGNIQLWPRPK